MVVVYHASTYVTDNTSSNFLEHTLIMLLAYFWTGVPMFFVISGYCIAATSDSTRRRANPLKSFFFRRFRRIYPPYWILIVLLVPVVAAVYAFWPNLLSDQPHSIPNPSGLSLTQWLGNMTLTERWRYHLFGGPQNFFLGTAWSLCYEEQFYVVCGVLLGFFPKRFFKALVIISIATVIPALLFFIGLNLPLLGFFFDGLWLLFAAGTLVYFQINYASPRQVKICRLVLVVAIIGSVLLRISHLIPGKFFPESAGNKFRAVEYMVGFSFALIISFLHIKDSEISEQKLLKPFDTCGKMCYSLYLVHWPIAKIVSHLNYDAGLKGLWSTLLLTIPLVVVLSVAAAWFFHVLVERRFLNQRINTALPDERISSIPNSPRLGTVLSAGSEISFRNASKQSSDWNV